MCYPKPGPRCSQHALLQYAKAHRTVLGLYASEGFSKKVQAGIKARQEAEQEFALTPAGIRELENQAKRNPTIPAYAERWEEAKAERARRLALVKGKKEIKHRKTRTEATFRDSLSKDGEVLPAIEQGDPQIAVAIEESAEWAGSLSDSELLAFRWYTQDGYSTINLYANTGRTDRFRPDLKAEDIEEFMEVLDGAMAKKPAGEARVVYRRHLIYEEQPLGSSIHNSYVDNALERFKEQYKPGDVFKPGFYMSASLDPNNGPSKDSPTGPILFEIRTRRAVSLNAVSAQGSRETEYLTPRDAEYRVVSTDQRVTLLPSTDPDVDHAKTRTVNVVQLEEI